MYQKNFISDNEREFLSVQLSPLIHRGSRRREGNRFDRVASCTPLLLLRPPLPLLPFADGAFLPSSPRSTLTEACVRGVGEEESEEKAIRRRMESENETASYARMQRSERKGKRGNKFVWPRREIKEVFGI